MYMRMIALALACALAGCQEAGRDVPQGPGLRMRDSDSSVTTVPKMRLAEPTNRTGQFAQPRARLPRELFEASVAQAPPPRVASLSPASAPSLIEEPRLAAVPRTVRQASRPDDSPRPQARRRAAAPAVSRSMPPTRTRRRSSSSTRTSPHRLRAVAARRARARPRSAVSARSGRRRPQRSCRS